MEYLTLNNGLDNDINGHKFFTLQTLLEWKKTMNRPKVQSDIELIEKLNKQSKQKLSRTIKVSKKPKVSKKTKVSKKVKVSKKTKVSKK